MNTPSGIVLTLMITSTLGQNFLWMDTYYGKLKELIINMENKLDRIEGTAKLALQKGKT